MEEEGERGKRETEFREKIEELEECLKEEQREKWKLGKKTEKVKKEVEEIRRQLEEVRGKELGGRELLAKANAKISELSAQLRSQASALQSSSQQKTDEL
jgi:predicted nuclease with TOPRIM domain